MEWLTAVGAVLAIVGVVGVAWAVLRANYQRTTLALYREDNDALRARVETLEGERRELTDKVADLRGAVSALREERAVLRDLATGASAVTRLEENLDRRLNGLEDLLRLAVGDADRRRHGTEEQP